MTDIARFIRDIPDFPKPGIIFKDITPLLANGDALHATIDGLVAPFRGKVDVVLGIESRGFIMAAAAAYAMGIGMAIARKPGKLPYHKHAATYALEYGTDTLEMHLDAVAKGTRVLLMDDLLATGGTASAAIELVQRCGGEVAGCAFVIELGFLDGRKRLGGHDVHALLTY